MKQKSVVYLILYSVFCSILSNCGVFLWNTPLLLLLAVPALLFVNVVIGCPYGEILGKRLRIEHHGTDCLKVFLFSLPVTAGLHVYLFFRMYPDRNAELIASAAWAAVVLGLLFWNGVLSVYLTSVQLGVRWRVLGILCGFVPVINLAVLVFILRTCIKEVRFETEKILLDEARHEQRICATKYPFLFVHGVFFRDSHFFNYWGRIPKELEKNGAVIYYGNHQSALSAEDSGIELTKRIKSIVEETGCGKVNVIAHSKGGMDVRAAIGSGAAEYIASLTTVNAPHRGCVFAEHLLNKMPKKVVGTVAKIYNAVAYRMGDDNPDFLEAVRDLTAARCRAFNETHPLPEGIVCRSVGAVMPKPRGGRFPLNLTSNLVKKYDGTNDGLVATDSCEWGEEFTVLRPIGRRGISHGDVIDLNRENIRGFDVREFYVQIAADLKNRGL